MCGVLSEVNAPGELDLREEEMPDRWMVASIMTMACKGKHFADNIQSVYSKCRGEVALICPLARSSIHTHVVKLAKTVLKT